MLDVHRNGSPIGTITSGPARPRARLPRRAAALRTSRRGNRLAIINEDPNDATPHDLSITFLGKRT